MQRMTLLDSIGILPVLSPDAVPMTEAAAAAYHAAGIDALQIPIDAPGAPEQLRAAVRALPGGFVSASNIRSVADCRLALDAGAGGVTGDGFLQDAADFCLEHGLAYFPSCKPGELDAPVRADCIKLRLPQGETGHTCYLEQLCSRRPQGLPFLISGDAASKDSFSLYAGELEVAAVEAPWLGAASLVSEPERLKAEASQAMHSLLGLRFAHIGVNQNTAAESASLAAVFAELLQTDLVLGGASDFAGNVIEVTKGGGLGTHGHIGIATNKLTRAMRFFAARGYRFDHTTERMRGDHMFAIYLEGEYGGFAVHIMESA